MALSPVLLRALTSVGSADTSVLTRSNSPALIAANRSDSVDAMILRFYLLVAALTLAPVPAGAQTSTAASHTALPEQPLLGSILNAGLLRDLPTSNSPFTVPETVQAETIGNFFSAGG